MCIFNKDFLADGILSLDGIKNEIVNFMNSPDTIITSSEINDYNNINEPMRQFAVSEFADFFLLKNKIPLSIGQLANLDFHENIEIFINFSKQSQDIVSSYIEYENEKDDCRYGWIDIKKNIFLKLDNKIKYYLKCKNIKLINNNDWMSLDFTKNLITHRIDVKYKTIYNDFILIRNNFDNDSLLKKEQIISWFKNELDFYISNKSEFNISETKFMKFDNSSLRNYWLSIFSHKGKATDNNVWEEIKTKYRDSKLEAKHKLCNDIFDSIVYLLYKINTN